MSMNFKTLIFILMLIIDQCLLQDVTSRFNPYKQHWVEGTRWSSLYMISQFDSAKSKMVCGSECLRNEECSSFAYLPESGTCQLGTYQAGCLEVGAEMVGQEGVMVYHVLQQAELTGLAHSIESIEEKALLQATTSVPLHLGQPIYTPENILNGDPGGAVFHAAVGLNFPWVQITLPKEMLVKGVKIHGRPNIHRQEYLEIRVGNSIVDTGDPFDTRICKNQLCYMTGKEDTSFPLSVDCAWPISGKYLTVQKYGFWNTNDKVMELLEVDVVVYCGPVEEADTCLFSPEDEVDHCAMTSLAAGKSLHKATAAEKLTWSVLASGDYDNTPPERAVDGTFSGYYPTEPRFFATTSNVEFPWFQADFLTTKLVQAVHIYPRSTGDSTQFLYSEVRVGHVNAASSVTSNRQRLCVNALCKTTGSYVYTPGNAHTDACSSPLEGQYLTIQQIKLVAGSLVFSEIDVFFLQ